MNQIIGAVIIALGIIIGAYIIAQSNDCASEALCQDLTPGETRVTCSGSCVNGGNCTVHYRKAGSSDKWEDSELDKMDRQGDGSIEYSCRC